MKTKYYIIAIIVALIGIGTVIVLQSDQENTSETTTTPTRTEQPSTTSTQLDTFSQPDPQVPGAYVAYSDSAFAEAKGVKVLFFHASWCRQCQMIEGDIKSEGVPTGVTVFKIDYDNAGELRKKYGVTLQTTVIKVTNDGQIIKKFVAYDTPSFVAVRENLSI